MDDSAATFEGVIPYPAAPSALGIDLGGTKIAAVVTDRHGSVVDRQDRVDTTSSRSNALTADLAAIVADVREKQPDLVAVGIGIAGAVTWPAGEILYAANHDHRGAIRRLVEQRTGLPVVVENDANAAAWAEARAGRSPLRHALVVTVGTGIGSGLVLDGELWRGRGGLGAEVGHTLVRPVGGLRCRCGRVGCLETVVSSRALVAYTGEIARRKDPTGAMARLSASGGLTARAVIDAARDGDQAARLAAARLGRWLGRGVASLTAVVNVEDVVVGGGLSELGELLLAPMRTTCDGIVGKGGYLDRPRVSRAVHGTEATAIGAAMLALREADARAVQARIVTGEATQAELVVSPS